jgi:hypothetical protein
MQDADRPLPVDRRGRVRMPAAKRAAILAEFAASGMTGTAFAAHVGVKYQTFAGWIRKDRLDRKALPTVRRGKVALKPVRFVEATTPSPPAERALELELPGGGRLRITDPSQIPLAAELLRSLRPC